MTEKIRTTTRWECDGCDLVDEFDGNANPVEALEGRRDHPIGWTRLVLVPLNDFEFRRNAELEKPRRLYCAICSARAINALDRIKLTGERADSVSLTTEGPTGDCVNCGHAIGQHGALGCLAVAGQCRCLARRIDLPPVAGTGGGS